MTWGVSILCAVIELCPFIPVICQALESSVQPEEKLTMEWGISLLWLFSHKGHRHFPFPRAIHRGITHEKAISAICSSPILLSLLPVLFQGLHSKFCLWSYFKLTWFFFSFATRLFWCLTWSYHSDLHILRLHALSSSQNFLSIWVVLFLACLCGFGS